MSKTLIIQSHRKPLPRLWLSHCVNSVENWVKLNDYEYRFLDDELFEILPSWVLDKAGEKTVIATDLARLKWMQKFLATGYERVIWMDADFLIFAPQAFRVLDAEKYALGREVWIQPQQADKNLADKYRVYTKVHNAFLMFRQGNHFLDFYATHAERLLQKTRGPMPPQFIGPKLLTALHNVVQCPVQENAGMLSPWVIKDKLNGSGPALDLFRQATKHSLAGANLCSSLVDGIVLKDHEVEGLIERLLIERVI